MVIWLYAIFSNEAELLPYFLRHYAPDCDRMILYDNASTDNSRAVIEICDKAEIRDYPTKQAVMDSVDAALFANETYHEARGKADWVIWVDCDEFLYSGESLRETLRYARSRLVKAIQAHGYQMLSNEFPKSDAPLIEQIRYGIRDDEYDKVAIFDPSIDLSWRPGRHVCRIADRIHIAYDGSMKLLHYRFLGMDYFKRRNAYNFSNRSAKEAAAGRSYHAAPDHTGKYSLAWYLNAMNYMSDIVTPDRIGVQYE